MAEIPVRVHRQRTRGWRMPENTVYVGRGTRFGNPWRIGLVSCGCRSAGECNHNSFRVESAAEAVSQYRLWVDNWHDREAKLASLRGKNLACWCALDQPCHADVLIKIANTDPIPEARRG